MGDVGTQKDPFSALLRIRLTELGIGPDSLRLIDEADIGQRERKAPFLGIFFGYETADDVKHPILSDLVEDSVVIIPVVQDIRVVSRTLPSTLHHINCLEVSGDTLERLASLVLESFLLLRADRRLFISYRRVEAQAIAIQLYEELDAAGFDVFLDTRGVPPAVDFQNTLWHRLADSDVIVLLDTPGFMLSRWTMEEVARANATNIQILHCVWPGSTPTDASAFSAFHMLSNAEFESANYTGVYARFKNDTLKAITTEVEALRARAFAARQRYLVDNFCDQARALGKKIEVQSSSIVCLRLQSGNIAVVPAVGVPNASRYQDIESAIVNSGIEYKKIWLLFDERGILERWIGHIYWLNKHLPVIAVCVSDSTSQISAEG